MATIFSSVLAFENTGIKPSAVGVGRAAARCGSTACGSGVAAATGSGVDVGETRGTNGSPSACWGTSGSPSACNTPSAGTETARSLPPFGRTSASTTTNTSTAAAPPIMKSRFRSIERCRAREIMGLLYRFAMEMSSVPSILYNKKRIGSRDYPATISV